ncbi:hypothetical protein ACGYT9_01815 [Burkholderia pseudomallei]|uniref:Uncharacterized protein n=11 Tax=Burkholderia pseudomallei TaxID=28450 RepID=A0AAX0UGR1_BURPE|nr:hypothetical protein [Burkholderia pseudomallei]ABN91943.1 hypothetical protein BURPS1106A_2107 [Burkholderia pseudomallei 1106a]AFR16022.1 hypothetical protein BPC006_I2152 [Burkholderia pseudomallei BPC006]EES23914.1 hypothetical protein BURPS1106B_A1342 [Burkholderia pseudomallei 1106b]EET07648.1 hypothetical protein BURPS1710A_2603 [Burkholderia pseudomallei 1710a]AUL55253.1 hypothetical protein BHT10_04525 [Burkholderia pseudomallei]
MAGIAAGVAVRGRPAIRRPSAWRARAGRSRRRRAGERAVAGVQGPRAAAAAAAMAMAMAANDVARRRTDADRRGHAGASPRAPVVDPVRSRMPAAATVPPLA